MKFSKKYKILLSPKLRKKHKIRYVIMYGGRGSGKSVAASTFLHDATFDTDNIIINSRFTATSAGISIMPEFQKQIINRNSDYFFEEQGNFIRNKIFNSIIYFMGLKSGAKTQTARLKSVTDFNIWFLDEAEELHDEEAFDDIDKSVRRIGYENLIILSFNTYRISKHHFIYEKFFAKHNLPNYFSGIIGNTLYIHTSYLDNVENLSESAVQEIEIAKNEYNANELKEFRESGDYYFDGVFWCNKKTKQPIYSQKYRWRYLGEFPTSAEGRVYNNVTYVDKIPANARRIPYGLDFGYSAPAAMVEVFYYDGGLYVNELIYESGLINLINKNYPDRKSLEERFKSLNLNKNTPIVCDSAEPKSIEDLALAGYMVIPCKKYAGSVKEQVKSVLNFPLFITKTSKNLIFEVENYVYSEKIEIPVKENDHLLNALEYVANSKNTLW